MSRRRSTLTRGCAHLEALRDGAGPDVDLLLDLAELPWGAHLGVGMEYDRGNVGDGGFIVRFSDGTETGAEWKAKAESHWPSDAESVTRRLGEWRRWCGMVRRCR